MPNSSPQSPPTFLQALPAAVVDRLAAQFATRSFPAGACIFREGEAADSVCFVAAGEVGLEMDVPGRGRQRILSVGPGDLLGWSPILDSTVMSARAVAISDAELLVASAPALRQLCANDHEVGYHFMREVARSLGRRLLATRLQLLDLFREESAASDL